MAIHKDNLQWLEQADRPFESIPIQVIEELLIKSPALDVSARSQGFINRFHIKNSLDAEALFEHLTEGVDVLKPEGSRCASSADEVETLLRSSNLFNGPFWNNGEFLLFTVSSETKTQVKRFVDEIDSSNSRLGKQKAELVKIKFQMVDSLFRHIRNSFAHGSFQTKIVQGTPHLVLQDGNTKGKMSARMVLKTERLEAWITDFYQFQKIGI